MRKKHAKGNGGVAGTFAVLGGLLLIAGVPTALALQSSGSIGKQMGKKKAAWGSSSSAYATAPKSGAGSSKPSSPKVAARPAPGNRSSKPATKRAGGRAGRPTDSPPPADLPVDPENEPISHDHVALEGPRKAAAGAEALDASIASQPVGSEPTVALRLGPDDSATGTDGPASQPDHEGAASAPTQPQAPSIAANEPARSDNSEASDEIATSAAAGDTAESQPAEEEDPTTKEWFGRGLPWTEWSRATGNWGDRRTKLQELGIDFYGSYVLDYSAVMSGGLRRRTALRGLLMLKAGLDLDPLIGLEGGTGYVSVYSQTGHDSINDVGDVQYFANNDADDFSGIYEAWWEQRLFDDVLRFKLGKVDANSEFAYGVHRAEFLNTSMALDPTTFFMFPTYPNPSMSANAFVEPTDWFSFGAGIYDGAGALGIPTGRRSFETAFDDFNNIFSIGEGQLKWVLGGNEGSFKLGGWYHDSSFTRFDGAADRGTAGWYAGFDQVLLGENPDVDDDTQGLGFFAQYGAADDHISPIGSHWGTGVAYTGLIPGRDGDICGFGVTAANLSRDPGAGFSSRAETAFELFYKAQLTPWLTLKPDIQYIRNPGGAAGVDDAVAATLRLELSF